MQVWNNIGLFRARRYLMAEGEIRVGAIPSSSPTFAWLPLWRPKALRAHEAAQVGMCPRGGGRKAQGGGRDLRRLAAAWRLMLMVSGI